MKLLEKVSPENPRVNLVWRFFSDSNHHWDWQRLTFDGEVVERSKSVYSQYDACLANASKHGYKSFPASSTKSANASSRVVRSYTGIAPGRQKLVAKIVPAALAQMEDIPIDDFPDGD